jgi:hypothetical protein
VAAEAGPATPALVVNAGGTAVASMLLDFWGRKAGGLMMQAHRSGSGTSTS